MAGMKGAAVPFTLVVVAFLSQGCTIGGGGGGGGGGGSDPNHDFEFNAFELLSQHNKHRCEHGVPLLTYSDIIAKNAQAWANTIAPQMEHSSFDSRSNIAGHWMLGENLFMGKSHMEGVVDAWYDEIRYTKNGLVSSFGHDTGHYTQVVWKETRELGCAQVGTLVVCQYGPTGNIEGGWSSNVLTPVAGKECTSDDALNSAGGAPTSAPFQPPANACSDSATYKDPSYKWGCNEWKAYTCDGQTFSSALKAACKSACGACRRLGEEVGEAQQTLPAPPAAAATAEQPTVLN